MIIKAKQTFLDTLTDNERDLLTQLYSSDFGSILEKYMRFRINSLAEYPLDKTKQYTDKGATYAQALLMHTAFIEGLREEFKHILLLPEKAKKYISLREEEKIRNKH